MERVSKGTELDMDLFLLKICIDDQKFVASELFEINREFFFGVSFFLFSYGSYNLECVQKSK